MVEYSRSGDVATVTIDRPAKRNALRITDTTELVSTLQRAEANARAVILTGADPAFCAGIDLTDSPITTDISRAELKDRLSNFQAIVHTIRRLEIPVITRINGPAMGAGCDIALAGDFRIATEEARLCESFINVGVVPGDGGAYLLSRLTTETTAKEMILLGKELSGEDAAEHGLVNEAVPADDLDDTVDSYVERVCSLPPTAMARNKQLIHAAAQSSLDDAHQDALDAFWESLQSGEFEEARRAFEADREPDYSTD